MKPAPGLFARLVTAKTAPAFWARRLLKRLLARARLGVVLYTAPEQSRAIRLVNQVAAETELLLNTPEAYQLLSVVQRTLKVPGDLAEVGVYRGGSARLICEVKGDRPLHLFDTFAGIPEVTAHDAGRFERGQFAASLAGVQRTLAGYSSVHFYPGRFPDTAGPVADRRFAFVHLDMDTYEGTLAGLEFFYPRLSRGGTLMCHDYVNAVGVRRAVDGFFAERPEVVLELAGLQCLVVKL